MLNMFLGHSEFLGNILRLRVSENGSDSVRNGKIGGLAVILLDRGVGGGGGEVGGRGEGAGGEWKIHSRSSLTVPPQVQDIPLVGILLDRAEIERCDVGKIHWREGDSETHLVRAEEIGLGPGGLVRGAVRQRGGRLLPCGGGLEGTEGGVRGAGEKAGVRGAGKPREVI